MLDIREKLESARGPNMDASISPCADNNLEKNTWI